MIGVVHLEILSVENRFDKRFVVVRHNGLVYQFMFNVRKVHYDYPKRDTFNYSMSIFGMNCDINFNITERMMIDILSNASLKARMRSHEYELLKCCAPYINKILKEVFEYLAINKYGV